MAKSPAKEAKPTKKRAHKEDGKFKADDPSTPDVNEAFEQPVEEAPKPAKASVKNVTVVVSHKDQVFVNVNGRRRDIERGVPTSIPAEMVDVLINGGVSVEIKK